MDRDLTEMLMIMPMTEMIKPIKPPFLCDPLTCSEADENPGDGEDDGPCEEEDAEQVGHPVAAVVVVG